MPFYDFLVVLIDGGLKIVYFPSAEAALVDLGEAFQAKSMAAFEFYGLCHNGEANWTAAVDF